MRPRRIGIVMGRGARSFSLLSDETKLVLGCGLVVLCFVLGWRVLGTWRPDFRIWPIADELARAGSGRLSDVMRGEWDVICYLVPYGDMRSQVRDGLRQAQLSQEHARGMPEFYMGENEFAFALLGIGRKPRILLIDASSKSLYFDLNGRPCHRRQRAAYQAETSGSGEDRYAKITLSSQN